MFKAHFFFSEQGIFSIKSDVSADLRIFGWYLILGKSQLNLFEAGENVIPEILIYLTLIWVGG